MMENDFRDLTNQYAKQVDDVIEEIDAYNAKVQMLDEETRLKIQKENDDFGIINKTLIISLILGALAWWGLYELAVLMAKIFYPELF